MKELRVVIALGAFATLTGCPTSSPGGGPTYTVSGTVTLQNLNATGNAVVTVADGASSFSVSVAVPSPDGAGNQAASFSVSGVPAGTYSVSLHVNSPASDVAGFYEVDGGGATAATPSNSSGSWTATLGSASVSSNVTLDYRLEVGYKVSGTLTLSSLSATGNAVVVLTQGSNSYSASVAVPAPDANNSQAVSYSISGIPSGTYTATISITTAVSNVFGTYTFNGSGPLSDNPSTSDATAPYSWTMSIPGNKINADAVLSATMTNAT